jgi:UDP-glucose 4-epimerase
LRCSMNGRAALVLRFTQHDAMAELPAVANTETILVTGGAGYIGSHTVRALRAADRNVVVLDSLELGDASSIVDAPLVVGDITDRYLVAATCKKHGVTQVVHFAAYKSVGESMDHPAKYWRNNVSGTVELVESCLAAGVRDIVFSSSCSVYGTPGVVPVTETESIKPESVYAETKAMVERILRWYGTTSGLRSVSLRYFNAAGASFDGRIGEDWTYSINLVPLVMKALLLGDRTLKVFGDDYNTPDGTCIRDYIHVNDLADAHVKALDYLAGGGESLAVNVGTGVGSSVLDVIKAVEKVSGESVPYEVVDRRPGDPVSTFAAPEFAQQTLGWTAQHDLDTIVKTAYAWHRSQVDAGR